MTDGFVDQFILNYHQGNFIMGDEDDPYSFKWARSRERFIIPLDDLRVSKRLRRKIRSDPFHLTINKNFHLVINQCSRRKSTWINPAVKHIYIQLSKIDLVHSLEVWDGDDLVGGLYGVAIGGVFFGESMFFVKSDASKIALVYLVDHLNRTGFEVLDAQIPSLHLANMGGRRISESTFLRLIGETCLKTNVQFSSMPLESSGARVIQRINQKSKRGCSNADKAGKCEIIQAEYKTD